MKKIMLASTLMIALNVGNAFAAPIDNLGNEQTAIGVQDERAYIEHKVGDTIILGVQKDDVYGQFTAIPHIRILAGSRNYHDDSHFYGGLALTASLIPNVNGYASLTSGNDFKEMQVGASLNIAPNLDLNVNYRSLMPDHGNDDNQTTVGATFKF